MPLLHQPIDICTSTAVSARSVHMYVCADFHYLSELTEEVQSHWLCAGAPVSCFPTSMCAFMGNKHSLCSCFEIHCFSNQQLSHTLFLNSHIFIENPFAPTPPVGSGTPAFRLGSRIDPHRHRGVVKVHWRVPWVGGLFSWVVATFTL